MSITSENVESHLEDWMEMSADLKQLKHDEMELRKNLVVFLDPNANPGTHEHGFMSLVAKVTIKLNHKISPETLEKNLSKFSEMELAAVRFKPDLVMKAYKMIPAALREMLDECLVVTPAAPTLNVQYRKPDNDE